MLCNILLLSLTLSQQSDTLRLHPAEALDLAVQRSRVVAAAESRSRAAVSGVDAARAWRNPTLSVTAENLGAQYQTTGQSGLAGTEGQATLSGWLPFGGDHGAGVRQAEALARTASATRDLSEQAVRAVTVATIAAASRDVAVARNARDEAAALEHFGSDMTRRAEEGRTPGGEAARARLEATVAAARAARRAAEAAASTSELRRLLFVAPDTILLVEAEACSVTTPATGRVAELVVADAQVDAARAQADLTHARGVPDLWPQVGLRRTAGFSGLLLGFSIDIPLLNSGGAATASARAEADAALAEREELGRRITADLAGAQLALAELEAAGRRFGPAWSADLEGTVTAAEARYEAGEATLAELLDARRARLAALDEYQTWRAERRFARARLARLGGATIDATLLCDDDVRGAP
jgi:cobalt-zinc-cadmium efflux system outer membrane protein